MQGIYLNRQIFGSKLHFGELAKKIEQYKKAKQSKQNKTKITKDLPIPSVYRGNAF